MLTLDGRVLPLNIPYVTPDTVKVIPGEGMYSKKQQRKGDLKVKFRIKFPESLSFEQKTKICAALPK